MSLARISIRMYDVGWGDCFLLRFEYARQRARHVLIDFGTTAKSAADERHRLMPIAENIRERCGGKLDAVIATHRHRDHIGGFAALKRVKAPGNVIAQLRPELVIQPWTESPRLERDPGPEGRHVKALAGMERFSSSLAHLLDEHSGDFDPRQRELLLAMAHQNYPNRGAVEGLRSLGKRRVYVAAGGRTGLDALLPGFSVRVIGPVRTGASGWSDLLRDQDYESWRKCFFWEVESAAVERNSPGPLFPNAPHWHPALAPPRMRWFIDRVNRLRADQMVSLARLAHSEINNTSLAIVIEGFGHRLLFPGDTEIRGWAAILPQPATRALLEGVTLYKASHHGAGNGTPRSVWSLLNASGARLQTLVSRHRGAPQSEAAFADELRTGSDLSDTAGLRAQGKAFVDIELEPKAPAVKLVA